MIPPTSILKVFPLQNVFEIKKCSSTKCFRTLRQERSDGKSLEAPPISQHKQFSILKTWWNTEGFHYKKVSLLWDITIPKYSSNPPLLSKKCIHTRMSVKHRRLLHEKFRYCETKKSTTNQDTHLPLYP